MTIVGRGWGVLIPGVNVDHVDVAAGLLRAYELGYTTPDDAAVVHYALQRWKRGEEEGADMTWQSLFPRQMVAWRMILAAAIVSGNKVVEEAEHARWLEAETARQQRARKRRSRWALR